MQRVGLDLFHQVIHCGIQLRVVVAHQIYRQVVHLDVRLHAVVFDDPSAIKSVQGELENSDVAVIQEGPLTADAAHASPGTGTSQRPEPVLAEEIPEDVVTIAR